MFFLHEAQQYPQPMTEGEVTEVKSKPPPLSQNLRRLAMKKNYMVGGGGMQNLNTLIHRPALRNEISCNDGNLQYSSGA